VIAYGHWHDRDVLARLRTAHLPVLSASAIEADPNREGHQVNAHLDSRRARDVAGVLDDTWFAREDYVHRGASLVSKYRHSVQCREASLSRMSSSRNANL
jgi:hypothetical protein